MTNDKADDSQNNGNDTENQCVPSENRKLVILDKEINHLYRSKTYNRRHHNAAQGRHGLAADFYQPVFFGQPVFPHHQRQVQSCLSLTHVNVPQQAGVGDFVNESGKNSYTR